MPVLGRAFSLGTPDSAIIATAVGCDSWGSSDCGDSNRTVDQREGNHQGYDNSFLQLATLLETTNHRLARDATCLEAPPLGRHIGDNHGCFRYVRGQMSTDRARPSLPDRDQLRF